MKTFEAVQMGGPSGAAFLRPVTSHRFDPFMKQVDDGIGGYLHG